jgi:hypothetical protein
VCACFHHACQLSGNLHAANKTPHPRKLLSWNFVRNSVPYARAENTKYPPSKNLARDLLAFALSCILISCGSTSNYSGNSGGNEVDIPYASPTSWTCIDPTLPVPALDGCNDFLDHPRSVDMQAYHGSYKELVDAANTTSSCGGVAAAKIMTAADWLSLKQQCITLLSKTTKLRKLGFDFVQKSPNFFFR